MARLLFVGLTRVGALQVEGTRQSMMARVLCSSRLGRKVGDHVEALGATR